MRPGVRTNRRFRRHFQRVPRPHVVQPECDATVLQEQFVTATSGIDRGFAVVQNHGTRRECFGANPHRKAERVGAREVADAGNVEAILAVERHRLAAFAINQHRAIVAVRGLFRIDAVRRLIRFEFIEVERRHEVRQRRLLRSRCQPFLEIGWCGSPRRGQCRFRRSDVLHQRADLRVLFVGGK